MINSSNGGSGLFDFSDFFDTQATVTLIVYVGKISVIFMICNVFNFLVIEYMYLVTMSALNVTCTAIIFTIQLHVDIYHCSGYGC